MEILQHPAFFLTTGALAGGLVAWLIVRARERTRASSLIMDHRTETARLEENAVHMKNELMEKQSRIEGLVQSLAQAESDLLQVSKDQASSLARLEHIPTLERSLEEKAREVKELTLALGTLQAKQRELETLLEKERTAMEEKIQLLESVRDQWTHTFEAISAKTLKSSQESFLALAEVAFSKDRETAGKDLEGRQNAISQMVAPIREALEKVNEQVQGMERTREQAYGSLSQQVAAMATTQQRLHKETANLVKALRTPQVRGRWGEITLRRVAELAGMLKYCDFMEQETRSTEEGRLRPDMIVKLPSDRSIVVDSKVPLLAFLEALEADSEKERTQKLAQHARQVQAHMNSLSQKKYWQQFQPAPEFVVLFIPGENFFSSALEQYPGLIEEGVARGVILATPTTLISLLKVVALGWRQETMAKNAEQIIALGMSLYERIGNMAAHLEKLGTQIDRCADVFNQAAGSFERRVLVSARRFQDFGMEKKGGEILPLRPLDKKTRKIRLLDSGSGAEEETLDS